MTATITQDQDTTQARQLSTPVPPEVAGAQPPIILVSGFGRCGTSLVCQMLSEAGLRVAGMPPTFEKPIPKFYQNDESYWAQNFGGWVVKVLDPQINRPPAGLQYRAIWLDRNPRQQALSQIKFLQMIEGIKLQAPLKVAVKKFEVINRRERPRAVAFLRSLCGPQNCVNLNFETLIYQPHDAARAVWTLFKPFSDLRYKSDEEMLPKISSVIRFRSADNYPGMMELPMFAEIDAKRRAGDQKAA